MKSRTWGGLAALVALAMVTSVAWAATTTAKFTKQVGGGSTGDSLTAAPDTSAAILIGRNTTSWIVTAAADSTCRYTVQISPDKVRWYSVVIDSTAGASRAEATAAQTYIGFFVRVILDPIPSGASPFGAAWVNETK